MAWYHLLHPRPAYVIGSGVPPEGNFMTASWVTPVATDEPLVALALDRETYTYKLVKKYGHFTIAIVEDPKLLWKLGTKSGEEVNKLELVEWFEGEKVKAPIPKQAIAWLEVKAKNFVPAAEVDLVIGEVVHWKALKGFTRRGWNLEEVKIPLQKAGRRFCYPCNEVEVK